jgi:putative ABC transport system substrate-binding protein
MAFGPSLADLFRYAATFVDKVRKGASPADLPREQPPKFELFMKTAKALGLTIAATLLARADEVIE